MPWRDSLNWLSTSGPRSSANCILFGLETSCLSLCQIPMLQRISWSPTAMCSRPARRCISRVRLFSLAEVSLLPHTTIDGKSFCKIWNNVSRWRSIKNRRKHRRIATTWLSQRAVDSYSPTLDRESLSLVKALFEESKGGLVPVNPQVCQTIRSQILVLTIAAPRRSLLLEQHDYHHFWLPYRQYQPPSCCSSFEAQSWVYVGWTFAVKSTWQTYWWI